MASCRFCGSARHTIDYCPGTWGGSVARMLGKRPRCSFCGSRKHNRDACPKAWPGPSPSVRQD